MNVSLLNTKGDLRLLHPVCRGQFEQLNNLLRNAPPKYCRFHPFETYRSPERQRMLYEQGRSQPGRKVTNADAWQSPHQFGLAVDFVPKRRKNKDDLNSPWVWDWDFATDEDWAFLSSSAASVGLSCPIVWDRPHVEARNVWLDWKMIIEYREGQDVWPGIEK